MFRFFPCAALLGLLLVFNSCERHHLGELPEVQREHMHPLQQPTAEDKAIEPTSPTPASPNEKP